jgi:hypothetical protein
MPLASSRRVDVASPTKRFELVKIWSTNSFVFFPVTSDTLDVWDDARLAAREFWERAHNDARLSDDVRSFCAANAKLLAN